MKLFKTCCLTLALFISALAENAQASFDFLDKNVLSQCLTQTKTDADGKEQRTLSIKDLGNCAQVNKHWNNASGVDTIWRWFVNDKFKIPTIPQSVYDQSITFRSIMAGTSEFKDTPHKFKTILQWMNVIRDQIGKKAHEQSSGTAPNLQLIVAAEILGDGSVIKTYLNARLTRLCLESKFDTLLKLLDEFITSGSQFAIKYKEDNKEFLPNDLPNGH